MPSFYAPNLKENSKQIELIGNEKHHICNVFRKDVNDDILLTNGNGILATAIIKSTDSKKVILKIESTTKISQSQSIVTAAFSLLKNKHDQLIVEKLTELGVKEFFPITTERTIRKISKNTIPKFKKVAVSAIKQCDNAYLPKIYEVQTLENLISRLQKRGLIPLTALETDESTKLYDITKDRYSSYCFIIGPEGGFTSEEIRFLKKQKVQTFTLGNHILRAETAAIATASQLLSFHLQKNSKYY